MLILASASPRRRELLTQAGFTFRVHPAHIPEDPYPGEDPIAYVTRLARQKADAVFCELAPIDYSELALKGHGFSRAESDPNEAGALAPQACFSAAPSNVDSDSLVVLGADTTVTLDNHILGKPESPADAARMLRLLSGRTHQVLTGVALVSATGARAAAEATTVTFLPLTNEEIEAYIATGEPMDKAGAYAIQGRAARWIPRIEGCYFNVVGLPLALVSSLLDTQSSLQTR
ncbi:MAG: Maf family protein [Terracidiphilus sp.]